MRLTVATQRRTRGVLGCLDGTLAKSFSGSDSACTTACWALLSIGHHLTSRPPRLASPRFTSPQDALDCLHGTVAWLRQQQGATGYGPALMQAAANMETWVTATLSLARLLLSSEG